MLSVARSRLAVLLQLSFLGINGLALLLSTIYTNNTPDLYENNSHHKFGWILIWIVVVQSIIAVVKLYTDRQSSVLGYSHLHGVTPTPTPISAEAMAQHRQIHATFAEGRAGYSDHNGRSSASDTPRTNSMSGTTDCGDEYLHDVRKSQDAESEVDLTDKRSLLGNNRVERFLSSMPNKIPRKAIALINVAHKIINCSILLLGFLAMTTGIVVYGGIFVSLACRLKICGANDKLAARKQCLQWACAFYQRWHILLVRPVDTCSMDGLFRRGWLGLEYQTPGWRRQPPKSTNSVGRVR